MAYNPKDYFFHKAKKENYAARSVFKLEEIDQRFRILRPAMKVLDLGAAPGSWSQFAAKKVGPKGRILGIDLQPIKITLPNAKFITADMRDLDLGRVMTENGIEPPFDIVMSDMAPKTTGIRVQDQTRSLELCMLALETAERFLKPGGTFIAKLFHSDEFEGFRDELKKRFPKVEVLRPKSTRKESKEIFFIGMQYSPKGKAESKSAGAASEASAGDFDPVFLRTVELAQRTKYVPESVIETLENATKRLHVQRFWMVPPRTEPAQGSVRDQFELAIDFSGPSLAAWTGFLESPEVLKKGFTIISFRDVSKNDRDWISKEGVLIFEQR